MKRTSPVARAGPGVRARYGGVMVTAVTATAAVCLAGCGTRTAGVPAGGGTAPATTASARPGTGPGPAASSRARAQALAGRLLSRLVLPPGARPVRLRVLPALLRQPEFEHGGIHSADIHRLFLLRQPMTAVQAFLERHLPAGMRRLGSGRLAGSDDIRMESVSFGPRADAEATWYPARSAAEHIDPSRYRAAVVSIAMLNPTRHTVTGTFTSTRVIARLARLVDGLPAAPDLPMGCPALRASYRITFVPSSRSAPRVVVIPSGCRTVGVTVGGAAQPALWDDTGLIRAAKRLLHVKSVV
jgi:hypothetical protein